MLESEKKKILNLDRVLAKSVVGQQEAVQAVAQAIRLSRSGLANPNQPSSFLFCGPSGTGKTLVSKSLAKGELLFNRFPLFRFPTRLREPIFTDWT